MGYGNIYTELLMGYENIYIETVLGYESMYVKIVMGYGNMLIEMVMVYGKMHYIDMAMDALKSSNNLINIDIALIRDKV